MTEFTAKLGTSELAAWMIARITVEGNCWVIAGHKAKRGGHIRFRFNGDTLNAHRAAYQLANEIPLSAMPSLLDHICNRPQCVNPDHLRSSTQRDNLLRGTNPPANNARKTHCDKGHPLDGSNVVRHAGHPEWRTCRICRNQNKKNSYHRLKK